MVEVAVAVVVVVVVAVVVAVVIVVVSFFCETTLSLYMFNIYSPSFHLSKAMKYNRD